MSMACCFVMLSTLLFLSTMKTNGSTTTLWSTRPLSLYSSGRLTSELPIWTDPSATWFIPVNEPPPAMLTVTLSYLSWKVSCAGFKSGRSAVEPEAEILPEISCAALLEELEACWPPPPQPVKRTAALATTAPTERSFFILLNISISSPNHFLIGISELCGSLHRSPIS